MKFDLDGKIALITGSSKGIGFAIAKALKDEGCIVALNSRNNNNLVSATDQIPGSIGLLGDVSDPEAAKRIVGEVVKKFGRLDILVCNAGNSQSVSPGSETYDEWQRIFSLNFWTATNCIEAAANALISSQGNIICISSICGVEVIPGAPITYSVAKSALNAYVRGIARPLGNKGVRINAITPGNINFEGSVWSKKINHNESAVKDMLKQNVSLERLGNCDDVARLAVYLASSNSQFVTGSVWNIDGGQVRS